MIFQPHISEVIFNSKHVLTHKLVKCIIQPLVEKCFNILKTNYFFKTFSCKYFVTDYIVFTAHSNISFKDTSWTKYFLKIYISNQCLNLWRSVMKISSTSLVKDFFMSLKQKVYVHQHSWPIESYFAFCAPPLKTITLSPLWIEHFYQRYCAYLSNSEMFLAPIFNEVMFCRHEFCEKKLLNIQITFFGCFNSDWNITALYRQSICHENWIIAYLAYVYREFGTPLRV